MGYYPTSDAMDWITDDDRGREINGRGGNDRFYGGAGNDVLIGGSGRDTLYGQVGDDVLHGGDHNDTLSGGPNDDLLYGDGGDDRIFGGRLGKDTLYGGAGDDHLWGRAGGDIFVFGANEGRDVIHDFDSDERDRVYFGPAPSEVSARMSSDGHLLVIHRSTEIKLLGLDMDDWNSGGILLGA